MKSLYEWCIENNRKDILQSWDSDRNKGITPSNVSYGSNKKYYWLCEIGHSWLMAPKDRRKKGCPYCKGHQLLVGFNDLKTKNPELAREWNYEKNGDLTPNQVTIGYDKKVWWKCSKEHEWEAYIYNRNKGSGCPYCSNRNALVGHNDLTTTNPKLAKEWNYERNGELKPTDILAGSHKMVWWKCSQGHEWEATVKDRSSGNNCPYCSNQKILIGFNDFYTYCKNHHRDDLIKEFDNTIDGLSMTEVTVGSQKKLWWKCSNGHSYKASPAQRIRGSGCGICGHRILHKGENDLLSTHPEIAKEWDYLKNKEKPDEVMAGSNKKNYWFICPKGHSYKTTLLNRKRGSGCPKCNIEKHSSFPEKAIFFYLKKLFDDAVENYKNSVLGTKEMDIYLPKLRVGIEYDGKAWHKNYKRDLDKDRLCLNNKILLIRIREVGCHNYESNSLKKYVTPYDMQELNETIQFVINFLNEKYKFKNKISIDVDRDRIKILEQMNLSEKKNSLASYCPEIKNFWHKEKNGKITPEQIPHASFKKIFLKCEKGHEWETTASYFSKNPWCPYCSGRKVWTGYNDLFTTNPELIPYWSKNNTIDPRKIKKGSNSNALWYCPTCKAEYNMRVIDKAKGRGCPYCSGHRVLKGRNLETTVPEILIDWDYKKNYPLKPDMVTKGSNKKVWWKCHVCGHEWKTAIANRTGNQKTNCPNCVKGKIGERTAKAVVQYTMDGEFVAEYKSAMEAERQTGIHQIHRVCRNERKSAGGYKWKYK